MKSGLNATSLLGLFAAVLAVYLAGFYGLEHLRHRKGPWTVTFLTDPNGQPALRVNQPTLDVSDVMLRFAGVQVTASNLPTSIAFDTPRKPVPFGTVLFEDLTFLPGVVTFHLFGHEIELLPRVLVVNHRPVPWSNGMALTLTVTNASREEGMKE